MANGPHNDMLGATLFAVFFVRIIARFFAGDPVEANPHPEQIAALQKELAELQQEHLEFNQSIQKQYCEVRAEMKKLQEESLEPQQAAPRSDRAVAESRAKEIAELSRLMHTLNGRVDQDPTEFLKTHGLCSITHDTMRMPVITCDGHAFEEESIREWFDFCKQNGRPATNPKTNISLENLNLQYSIDIAEANKKSLIYILNNRKKEIAKELAHAAVKTLVEKRALAERRKIEAEVQSKTETDTKTLETKVQADIKVQSESKIQGPDVVIVIAESPTVNAPRHQFR